MEILLASANLHKFEEFKKMLGQVGSTFSILKAQESLEVEESGGSYTENAYLKAKAYYEKFNTPTMSDDSGLDVLSLPDELGIYSARFGGEGLSDSDRVNLLLDKLQGQGFEDRQAAFTCVLCFYLSPKEVFFFEGRLTGYIANAVTGSGGFGYDPVFIPFDHGEPLEEKEIAKLFTLAENPSWKKENSHRAKACRHAIEFFKERVCQNV
mgnify:CR=1 FL=1|tara:strand:- start:9 stop:638 length:630 start_codon:yes stop_codon:yes gene_type:complete